MFEDYTVLYIDDEYSILSVTSGLLKRFFKEVFTEENGEDGLKTYLENQDKIDLIITDITMPRMDGITMSEEIRKIDPTIPILVTSALNDSSFFYRAINIGINGYIIKPIDFKVLIEKIGKVLEPIILKKQLKQQEEENQERLLKSAKFTAIGQLTAGLTHEINTPLTYVKGSVEIMKNKIKNLEDEKLKQVLTKHYNLVEDGVNRISNIVDSMSEMAKKSSEQYECTNIYETIIVAIIMAYNRSKHITKININNEPFSMNIDKTKYNYTAYVQRQRVEQVWIIIINNALDELIKIVNFDERSLDITVEENQTSVKVCFKDNGGGIANDMFDKLFEPFASDKTSSGMGVGLSIAKKIIIEQDGTIDAHNENNCAVFEVTLNKKV